MIFVARHGIGMVSATVAEGEFLRTVEPARALARTTTGASTTTMRSLQAARCGRARARWALCRAGESRGDAARGPHRACSGPAPTGRVPDRHEGEKVASPLGICGGESRSGEPPVHTAPSSGPARSRSLKPSPAHRQKVRELDARRWVDAAAGRPSARGLAPPSSTHPGYAAGGTLLTGRRTSGYGSCTCRRCRRSRPRRSPHRRGTGSGDARTVRPPSRDSPRQ